MQQNCVAMHKVVAFSIVHIYLIVIFYCSLSLHVLGDHEWEILPQQVGLGGLSVMLSFVIGVSQVELEYISLAISTCQATQEIMLHLQEPNAASTKSTPTFSLFVDVPHQLLAIDAGILEANKPIEVVLDAYEDMDLLDKFVEANGKNIDVNDILSRISSLEETQRYVLKLLRFINQRLHTTPTTPPKSAHKQLQFPTGEDIELHTL